MPRTWPIPARELAGLPVRLGAVEIGTVVDVLVSPTIAYVLGLEVQGRDGRRHFLPWVGAVHDDAAVEPASVFSLLSASELAVYVDNGVRLLECEREVRVGRDGVLLPAESPARPRSAPLTSRSTRFVHADAKRSLP